MNLFFFFQAEDGIRDATVTGVQTCALPISALRKSSHVLGSPIPTELKRSLRQSTGIAMKKSGSAYHTPLTCAALLELSIHLPYFLLSPSATSERSTRLR